MYCMWQPKETIQFHFTISIRWALILTQWIKILVLHCIGLLFLGIYYIYIFSAELALSYILACNPDINAEDI